MKKYFTLIIVILPLLLATCNPICPITLTALDFWYESDSFTGYNEITMLATFRNDRSSALTFVPGETFQLWIRNIIGNVVDPPVIINEEPSGSVVPGSTFTYNLTIDVSDFSKSFVKLNFRGVSSELGTLSPSDMPLVEVSFTCN